MEKNVIRMEGGATRLTITSTHHVLLAQKAARTLAQELGFSRTASFAVATCASELASNLILHAGGGTITLAPIKEGSRVGLRMIAEDRGPGIENIERAMEDGFSTGGGLGGGLPAVRRLMDECQIGSVAGKGTRVVATKWIDDSP